MVVTVNGMVVGYISRNGGNRVILFLLSPLEESHVCYYQSRAQP